jgi:hypothetical protein
MSYRSYDPYAALLIAIILSKKRERQFDHFEQKTLSNVGKTLIDEFARRYFYQLRYLFR